MKKLFLSVVALCVTLFVQAKDYADYVSPLVGTQSSFELSTGNTYPAISRPWGMNFWTPQTGKMGDGWQYVYTANKIRGFKQTHQPSPWINDYGQFSIMPVTGKPEFEEDKRASWFSHKAEIAKPYYYKVYLAEHDVVTEMVPTERAVMFRFTFPENDSYVVVDAFDRGSSVKVIPGENKIVGYTTRNSGGVPANFKNYFVIEFDKPFTYEATFSNDVQPEKPDGSVPVTLKEGKLEQTDFHTGAVIGFKTKKGEVVHARVASSFISPEQAIRNLKELGGDSFEVLVQKGKEAWNEALGKVEVEGGTLDQYRTFYSCLYRSLLFPRKFYELDANGQPVHYSPYNGETLPGYMYTDTGFWDTFRCLFPFLNLMYPSVNKEIQEGLVNTYKESGFFPEWASPGHRGCMVGNNSASILRQPGVPLGRHPHGPGSGPRPAQGRGHDRRKLRHPHPCGAGRAHAAKPAQAGQHRQRQGRPADHGPGHFAGTARAVVPTRRAALPRTTQPTQAHQHGGPGTALVHRQRRRRKHRLAAARLETLRPKPLPPAQPSRGLFHRAPRAHHRVSRLQRHTARGRGEKLHPALPGHQRAGLAHQGGQPRASHHRQPEIHLPLLALAPGLHRRRI